jgi:NAD(P)-dependent dehydrogenase (short-subunit alcohol dehydrogenase family)
VTGAAEEAEMTTDTYAGGLDGAVIAVAGAGGPAGRAVLQRLARAGGHVVAADHDPERLAEAVDAARYDAGGADITGEIVDLLDLEASQDWAGRIEKDHGRVDGLVHLVGGWRGSASFPETDLADWGVLQDLLIRTVQHTSLAFHDGLMRSPGGRYVLISATAAGNPTAGNAAYAAAKAAAEAWTLALGDSFRRLGGDAGPTAAATVLVVKALVHDSLRAERPQSAFAGFTDVRDLAEAVADVWNRNAVEVNGTRQWLTPQP